MNKEINLKLALGVIALATIVFLGIGFAAYNKSLSVGSSSSATTATTSINFGVQFDTAAVTGKNASGTADATNCPAVSPTASSITGLSAKFSAPGQSCTWTFSAKNKGAVAAYLNAVTLGSKTCTPASGTSSTLTTQACNGISLSVKVNSKTYSASNNAISSSTLAVGGTDTVVVTVSYASGSAVTDGTFSATFGTTTLKYDAVD